MSETVTGLPSSDARDTGTILAEAGKLLDFGKPVAVMLIAVLHITSWARQAPGRADVSDLARQLAAYTTTGQFTEGLHYLLEGISGRAEGS